jgi:hypothetical protein
VIKGTTFSLPPVGEADRENYHRKFIDIEGRGPWYRLPRTSLTKSGSGKPRLDVEPVRRHAKYRSNRRPRGAYTIATVRSWPDDARSATTPPDP